MMEITIRDNNYSSYDLLTISCVLSTVLSFYIEYLSEV